MCPTKVQNLRMLFHSWSKRVKVLPKSWKRRSFFRAQAQATKKEIAEYKANLDREKEREVEKARYEARRIVENVRAESEKLLDELQEIRKQKDSEAFSQLAAKAKSQMRSNLNHLYDLSDPVAQKQQEAYKLPRPLIKGDTVFVTDLGAAGKVLSCRIKTVWYRYRLVQSS